MATPTQENLQPSTSPWQKDENKEESRQKVCQEMRPLPETKTRPWHAWTKIDILVFVEQDQSEALPWDLFRELKVFFSEGWNIFSYFSLFLFLVTGQCPGG